LKEWTTPDTRITPSTTNLEEEEIVDAPGKDGNASMPEEVKRPNPWRKMMMMISMSCSLRPQHGLPNYGFQVSWLALAVRFMTAELNRYFS
jgi:hypothetical protein